MKSILIQCLSGNGIGKIKLNHINNNKKFYFVCKYDGDLIKKSKGIKKVLILEYQEKNSDKYCVGVAEGDIEDIDRIDDNFLIEINNFETKSIKYNNETGIKDNYSKIRDAIKCDISSINEEVGIQFLDDDSLENTKKCIDEINKKNEKNKKSDEEYKAIMKSIENLEKVGDLAQRSIYAKRVIGKGDIRGNRTEFQRDWERIIHAKSFRRLEDKAQIYTLSKGDHFRTRLTHTLEVTQIARGIARELYLNEDLVEAIALGHDLGHTPFGHVGERTLNEILQNEGVEGGFKHNFQGVKVVNYLEEKYGEFEGIDLTYQVMEGILKHTKVCDCEDKKLCSKRRKIKGLNCPQNNYKIESFLCNGNKDELHTDYSFATTLEGQAVAVADEIAQRAHDLDDGIASGIINEEQFLNELKEMAREEFYERLKKEVAKEIYDTIEVEKKSLDDTKKKYTKNKLVNIAKKKILKDLSEEQRTEFIYKEYFDVNKIMDNIKQNVTTQFLDVVEDKLIAKYTSTNSIENILLDIHKDMDNHLKKIFIDSVKSDIKNEFVEAVGEFLKDKDDYFKFLLKDNKSKSVKEEKDKLKVEVSKRLKKYEEIECDQKIEDSLIDKRNDAKMKFYEDIEKLLEFKYLVVLDDINKIIKTIDCYRKLDKEIQEILDKHINDIMNKTFIIKIKTENQMKKKALESKFEDELYNRIKKSLAYIKEDQRDYIDELDIKRARIVSDVITYFIDRIKNDSKYRIENYEKENLNNFKCNSWIVNEELIKFSEKTDDVRVKLEKISSSRIINSEEVNCFDGKGKYVIKRIYKAYNTNPMQMSKTTLKRIYREVCRYTNYAVDITDFKCSRDKAEKEIAIYNGKDHSNDLKIIKHKVFVRCLVDLISGMTDDFANRQYDKLYSPRIY